MNTSSDAAELLKEYRALPRWKRPRELERMSNALADLPFSEQEKVWAEFVALTPKPHERGDMEVKRNHRGQVVAARQVSRPNHAQRRRARPVGINRGRAPRRACNGRQRGSRRATSRSLSSSGSSDPDLADPPPPRRLAAPWHTPAFGAVNAPARRLLILVGRWPA